VLGTDPAKDAAGFADVRYTIRAGRVIYSHARDARAEGPSPAAMDATEAIPL
jgi:hypothetical protein